MVSGINMQVMSRNKSFQSNLKRIMWGIGANQGWTRVMSVSAQETKMAEPIYRYGIVLGLYAVMDHNLVLDSGPLVRTRYLGTDRRQTIIF